MDGLTPNSIEGNSKKIYEITENKEYKFKVVGTNGRIGIDKIKISSIIKQRESLLAEIDDVKESVTTNIKVVGNSSTEKYSLNVIYYKGDLRLGEKAGGGQLGRPLGGGLLIVRCASESRFWKI